MDTNFEPSRFCDGSCWMEQWATEILKVFHKYDDQLRYKQMQNNWSQLITIQARILKKKFRSYYNLDGHVLNHWNQYLSWKYVLKSKLSSHMENLKGFV